MFKKITLTNFRTHKETSLELGAVNLLLGDNNAGKSNLLHGISHFSNLIATKSNPELVGEQKKLTHDDLFPHRHKLSKDDEPMGFECHWTHELGEVIYTLQLYAFVTFGDVGCIEKIKIFDRNKNERFFESRKEPFPQLLLWSQLRSSNLNLNEQELIEAFFCDFIYMKSYNFQPSFLKEIKADKDTKQDESNKFQSGEDLGSEGQNLHKIIKYIKDNDQKTFDRLILNLRRFDSSFHSIRFELDTNKAIWSFDFGGVPARLEEFPPSAVSDGLLRAAAISLLALMSKPPAFFLVEEIENGISQKNLRLMMGWLRQAAGRENSTSRGYDTQFILTSHSPSVLREFSDHLDEAFYIVLKGKGHKSVVTNLNTDLSTFVDMNIIEADDQWEKNGKRIIKLSPSKLMEMWYGGAIGGA